MLAAGCCNGNWLVIIRFMEQQIGTQANGVWLVDWFTIDLAYLRSTQFIPTWW